MGDTARRRSKRIRERISTAKHTLGSLEPLPGSVHTCPILIKKECNSYGRDPRSDFVHPDSKFVWIPKNAIDITLHYPGLEQDLGDGQRHWYKTPELVALISTRATHGIWVNGVRLRRGGKDRDLYGELYTGDIIRVFKTESRFLELKFAMNTGRSQRRRDGGFKIHIKKR